MCNLQEGRYTGNIDHYCYIFIYVRSTPQFSSTLSLYAYSNVLTQNFWFNRSTKYICWLLHEHNQHLCLVASSLPGYILYDFTVSVHMVVSWNTSKSSIFIKKIHYKPSIVGYPRLWTPPYDHMLVFVCMFLFTYAFCSTVHHPEISANLRAPHARLFQLLP
jgi:hypothetical protein